LDFILLPLCGQRQMENVMMGRVAMVTSGGRGGNGDGSHGGGVGSDE
jgi:hypothetical protein